MMKNLAAAVVKAQQAFPPIPKDALNPHFKSKFASLHGVMENVLPVLNANGLALMQHPTSIQGFPALRTVLIHAESGEQVEDTMLLMLAKNDPQGQGSALTYARRYALLSTLGLVADEDDDAHSSSAAARPASSTPEAARPYRSEPATSAADGSAGSDDPPMTNSTDPVVPFGKHKGKRISEIPPPYLVWLSENFEPKDEHDQMILSAVKDAVIPF